MPAISLVVCLHRERDLLQRLLQETAGLYDDLVVIHDGQESEIDNQLRAPAQILTKPPAIDYANLAADSPLPNGYHTAPVPAQTGSIHELTSRYHGRYFEGPRCFQQEPHWPFAWSRARHDWILRLDADEFPSAELKEWLRNFRGKPDIDPAISGYVCIWPVWDGAKTVTRHWPAGRNFLFHRGHVHFFGMVEQVPIADDHYDSLSLALRHQPRRKSHGLANILFRKQGAFWRVVIAQSMLGRPQDLPQWRWADRDWPELWQALRTESIPARMRVLARHTLSTIRNQWRTEHKIMPLIAVATPLHHFMITLLLNRMRRERATTVVTTTHLPRTQP